ncbi:hypothetical protein DRB89_35640 [Streptomyces sp. ICC4]|nr:hypothetical protein DRB89_35640 [Streptomyces sp. ICC4]
MEALVDAHLLESPEPGRYQFHCLVRALARSSRRRRTRRTSVRGRSPASSSGACAGPTRPPCGSRRPRAGSRSTPRRHPSPWESALPTFERAGDSGRAREVREVRERLGRLAEAC